MKTCGLCGGKIIEDDDQYWMIQSENGGEIPEGYCEKNIIGECDEQPTD